MRIINRTTIAYAELAMSAVIIGSSVVAGKYMTGELPVMVSQTISLIFAALVFVPMLLIKEGKFPAFSGKEWLLQFGQAFLGMFMFRVLMFAGLRYASAVDAGLATSTSPAVVALLSLAILKEKFTKRRAIGVICSFLGVLVVQMQIPAEGTGIETIGMEAGKRIFGMALMLLAVIGEGSLTVLRKLTPERVSPLAGSTMIVLLALPMFAAGGVVEIVNGASLHFSLMEWALMLYYGVIITVGGYLLWFMGISVLSAGSAAVFTGCIPVSALILSGLLLHEPVGLIHVAGVLLVIAGIGLHAWNGKSVGFPIRIFPQQKGKSNRGRLFNKKPEDFPIEQS